MTLKYFSFYIPNYKHNPKYKKGVWDGKIREFNKKTQLLPKGLMYRLYQYAKDRNIDIVNEVDFTWNDRCEYR